MTRVAVLAVALWGTVSGFSSARAGQRQQDYTDPMVAAFETLLKESGSGAEIYCVATAPFGYIRGQSSDPSPPLTHPIECDAYEPASLIEVHHTTGSTRPSVRRGFNGQAADVRHVIVLPPSRRGYSGFSGRLRLRRPVWRGRYCSSVAGGWGVAGPVYS
jgi:hypothetical protein